MTGTRIIAICIALLGVILAGRALLPVNRSAPGAQTPSHTTPADPAPTDEPRHPPSLPAWDSLSFSSLGAEKAIASIGTALDDEARWAETALPPDARSELRERFLRRISYVLRASEDDRLAAARAEGATRTDPPEGLSPESVERQRRWPGVWADAPIDVSGVRVRLLDMTSRAAYEAAATPAVTRSSLAAEYGASASTNRFYELILPIKPLASPDGSKRVPAFLGIAYERTPSGAWRPGRISVYTSEHPGGRPIIAPPL